MSEPLSSPQPTAGLLTRGVLVAGRYRLEATIAAGGMATVWRAIDTILTRPVALKVLHAELAADPDFVARFRREAVAAARLTHPNIVSIYDTCDDPEAIVMELVDGRTLRDELDARGFVPAAEVVAIGSAICEALEAAHRSGVVHRDIKPANVLLSGDGRVKVADFGIAKAAAGPDDDPDLPDVTAIGKMVGTAKYLAPEQVSGGPVDARTDVYALGVVLYEMACGRAPFGGDNDLAVATARLHGPPSRPMSILRTIPERLDAIIMRALATSAEDRYPSAVALWADLQSCPTGDTSPPPLRTADATTTLDQPSFTSAERSWLLPAGLISLVGVALVLAWLLIGGTEVRRELLDLVDRVAPDIGTSTEASTTPMQVTARTFDPLGDGVEHDDLVGRVVDGDPTTGWHTERYGSRTFGGLKEGVGIVFDLGGPRDLTDLSLLVDSAGWAVVVYVADAPGATLADWGTAAASVSGAAGTTSVDLSGQRGSHLLLWITDLGTDPDGALDVAEVTVGTR